MPVRVLLGGFPALLEVSTIQWQLSFGGLSPTQSIPFSPSVAEEVLRRYGGGGAGTGGDSTRTTISRSGKGSGETTLEIESGDGRSLVVRRVIVVGEGRAPDPWTRMVLIADLRWYWRFRHIGPRRYNIRRSSGTRRLLDDDPNVPDIQVRPLVADQVYHVATLKDGAEPWTAREIAQDVLSDLAGDTTSIRYAWTETYPGDDQPPENVEIDADGPAAAAHAVALLAGRDLYVNLLGEVVVTDRIGGVSDSIVDAMGPELHRGGHLRRVDMSPSRPKSVRSLFTPEFEVRFQFTEADAITVSRSENRTLENVAPITDPSLAVGGQTYAQGTFTTFAELIAAWAADRAGLDSRVADMSVDLVRTLWFNDAIRQRYIILNAGFGVEPSSIWSGRVATCLQHYRQTFRINPDWMGRILAWRPIRVAIADQETGTRAPSQVYADYCMIPTIRRLALDRATPTGEAHRAGWNVSGYSSNRPAPAVVQVISPDEGILRIDYRVDPWDDHAKILPSRVANLPTVSPIGLLLLWERTKLAPTHNIAVVLSVVPMDPKLYIYDIAPDDVGEKGGKAPSLDRRVGPGLETARFAWEPSRAAAVERHFGVRQTNLLGQVMDENADLGIPVNEDVLVAMAEAQARQVYLGLRDHWLGERTMPFHPALQPRGEFDNVIHQVSTQGQCSTIVTATTPPITMSILDLLPASAKRVIMRQVQR